MRENRRRSAVLDVSLQMPPTRSCAVLPIAAAVPGPAAVAAEPPRGLAPRGWDADARLREAADATPTRASSRWTSPPRVAEVEVAPGTRVKAWTYDGGLPGPLIRAKVGDRLIVHFTNQLAEPTTIHWHGVRVPIEMDGVPGISQPEVKTGRVVHLRLRRPRRRRSTGITRT